MTGLLTQDTSNHFRRRMRRGRLLTPNGWRAVALGLAGFAFAYLAIRTLVTP